MFGRAEIIMKWGLFAAATALVILVQGLFLQYLHIFGVMPFLYPVLVAMVAMRENSAPSTLYALILGVLCDLTLTVPFPCFYTLIFPVIALCVSLISQSWLPAGFFCSLLVSVLAFLMTDLFHCLVLALTGKPAWAAGAILALRETGAAIFFVPFIFLLFRAVHRKCHEND